MITRTGEQCVRALDRILRRPGAHARTLMPTKSSGAEMIFSSPSVNFGESPSASARYVSV
jgi:hypothetical protein